MTVAPGVPADKVSEKSAGLKQHAGGEEAQHLVWLVQKEGGGCLSGSKMEASKKPHVFVVYPRVSLKEIVIHSCIEGGTSPQANGQPVKYASSSIIYHIYVYIFLNNVDTLIGVLRVIIISSCA